VYLHYRTLNQQKNSAIASEPSASKLLFTDASVNELLKVTLFTLRCDSTEEKMLGKAKTELKFYKVLQMLIARTIIAMTISNAPL